MVQMATNNPRSFGFTALRSMIMEGRLRVVTAIMKLRMVPKSAPLASSASASREIMIRDGNTTPSVARIPPTSGTAAICGHDIINDPVGAKSALGYLPEAAPSYRAMTVEDFLTFAAKIRGFGGAEAKAKVDAVVAKAGLEKVTVRRSR